jgi:hypothetical protein
MAIEIPNHHNPEKREFTPEQLREAAEFLRSQNERAAETTNPQTEAEEVIPLGLDGSREHIPVNFGNDEPDAPITPEIAARNLSAVVSGNPDQARQVIENSQLDKVLASKGNDVLPGDLKDIDPYDIAASGLIGRSPDR